MRRYSYLILSIISIFLVVFIHSQPLLVGNSSNILPITNEGIVFPEDISAVLNIKKDFGAKGDGVNDDTQAFIDAIDTVNNRRNPYGYIIYIPDGTYKISDQINYSGPLKLRGKTRGENLSCVRFLGQNRDKVILKLEDNAVGFSDPSHPYPFISFGKQEWGVVNNKVGSNYVENLTIDVGSNNPGAIGLVFHTANTGAIRNLTIQSSDADKSGSIGFLDPWSAGHGYYKNILIDGFDVGIEHLGTTMTISAWEHITVRDQKQVAIKVAGNSITMRDLMSQQKKHKVSTIEMTSDQGQVILLESNLEGKAEETAISLQQERESHGQLFARKVSISGYHCGIANETECIVPGSITDEYSSHGYRDTSDDIPSISVNLPVKETPTLQWVNNPEDWASVDTFGASGEDLKDDSSSIQAAMDSGKSVIFFPKGSYIIKHPITIPSSVQQVQFLFTSFKVDSPLLNSPEGMFRIIGESTEPLLIQELNLWRCKGSQYLIEHASLRPIVMKDLHWQGTGGHLYFNSVPGGTVYLENTSSRVSQGVSPNFSFRGQSVYSRWLNPEYGDPYVSMSNSRFWMLGMKGERGNVNFKISNRSQAEIFGFIAGNFGGIIEKNIPVLINNNSQVTALGFTDGSSSEGYYYHTILIEIRDGIKKILRLKELPKRINRQDQINRTENHAFLVYSN